MKELMNKIHCCDCIEFMKKISDKSVDLIITDPPYNVGIDYENTSDNNIDYYTWCDSWFNEAMRVSKCLVFTPGMVNLNYWYSKNPLWTMCWYKNNQCSRSKIGGFNVWEPILVFGKVKTKISQDGFSIPISMQSDASFHPVPKSYKAWYKVIDMFTEKNDVVMDIFSGSGTTAKVCEEKGLDYICVDISSEYVLLTQKRLEPIKSQGKLFAPQ